MTTSNNDRVLNNTVVSATGGMSAVTIHKYTAGLPEGTTNKVWNNILYHYDTGGTIGSISVDTAAETNFQSDYNVVMSVFTLDDGGTVLTLAQWQARGYDTHSVQAADTALFVAPGTDFHLKAGSPAINRGTTLADCTDDKDGNARPLGTAYDVGCYEYGIADLNITTTSLPGGTVGTAYSQTLAATGGVTPTPGLWSPAACPAA